MKNASLPYVCVVYILCSVVASTYAQQIGGMEFITAKDAVEQSQLLIQERFDSGALLSRLEYTTGPFGNYEIACNYLNGTATCWTTVWYLPSRDSLAFVRVAVPEPFVYSFGINIRHADTMYGSLRSPVVSDWVDSDLIFSRCLAEETVVIWMTTNPSFSAKEMRIEGETYSMTLQSTVGVSNECRCYGDARTGVPLHCETLLDTEIPESAVSFIVGDLVPQPLLPHARVVTTTVVSETEAPLTVELADALGRRIAMLYNGNVIPGANTIRMEPPRPLASGTYLVVFTSGNAVQTKLLPVIR